MKTITVSKGELYEAYHNLSADVAAASFGVCIQTFYNMLDSAGIERKRKGVKRGENVRFKVVD